LAAVPALGAPADRGLDDCATGFVNQHHAVRFAQRLTHQPLMHRQQRGRRPQALSDKVLQTAHIHSQLIFQQLRTICTQREQVVIFSHFLGMLDLFELACQAESIGYIRIDGSTNDRQSLVDRFNRNDVPVALCSLKAAAYGINLTAANHVIHADRWWNPATEAQATDRVHRIGQDKTVYVYKFLVQGTLEEWIDALLTTKRKMAQQIVGAAGEQQLHWTREELIEILRPID